MEKPNYYGILPANVRYDKKLKPMEKILYTELTALSNKNGYCNATNSYFAELYDVGKNTVSVWINNLIQQGYLKSEIIYENKEVKERRLYISIPPITKNNDTPITKNREDNNTRINNTRKNINKKIIIKKVSQKEAKKNEVEEFIQNLEKDNEYKELLFEYVQYRKKIKKTIHTIKPIEKIINNFPSYFELEDALNIAMSNEWQGIEPEWVANYKNTKAISKTKKTEVKRDDLLVSDDYLEKMKERYGII